MYGLQVMPDAFSGLATPHKHVLVVVSVAAVPCATYWQGFAVLPL